MCVFVKNRGTPNGQLSRWFPVKTASKKGTLKKYTHTHHLFTL